MCADIRIPTYITICVQRRCSQTLFLSTLRPFHRSGTWHFLRKNNPTGGREQRAEQGKEREEGRERVSAFDIVLSDGRASSQEDDQEVREATNRIVKVEVPKLAAAIEQGEVIIVNSRQLVSELHKRGINLRYESLLSALHFSLFI